MYVRLNRCDHERRSSIPVKESDSECGGTFFERVRGGLREKERVGDSVSILDFGEYREFLGSEVRSKKKHQKKSRFEKLSYITVPFVALCTLAHSSRFSLAHRLSAHCVLVAEWPRPSASTSL